MNELISTTEARWAEKPNALTLHAGDECPQPQTSVTVLVTSPSYVMAVFVAKRGWDTPGGHIEAGESTFEAAVREVWEEAGLRIDESQLSMVGWTHLHLQAPMPDRYAYPYPHTYQPVLHCSLTDDQMDEAGVRTPEEITKVAAVLHEAAVGLFHGRDWTPLLERVLTLTYPKGLRGVEALGEDADLLGVQSVDDDYDEVSALREAQARRCESGHYDA